MTDPNPWLGSLGGVRRHFEGDRSHLELHRGHRVRQGGEYHGPIFFFFAVAIAIAGVVVVVVVVCFARTQA